jgi:hypothetical protein
MEGFGWFEGYAARKEIYRIKSPLSLEWLVIKGMAIGAVVGWLVPMWFYINRSKAPDQIAGRLIFMNKKLFGITKNGHGQPLKMLGKSYE